MAFIFTLKEAIIYKFSVSIRVNLFREQEEFI